MLRLRYLAYSRSHSYLWKDTIVKPCVRGHISVDTHWHSRVKYMSLEHRYVFFYFFYMYLMLVYHSITADSLSCGLAAAVLPQVHGTTRCVDGSDKWEPCDSLRLDAPDINSACRHRLYHSWESHILL